VFLRSVLQLSVIANVPSSFYPDDGGDMLSETSVPTTNTRGHIPEDGILHSYGRVHLKSYLALTGWTV
jgi:hypothetical protein